MRRGGVSFLSNPVTSLGDKKKNALQEQERAFEKKKKEGWGVTCRGRNTETLYGGSRVD